MRSVAAVPLFDVIHIRTIVGVRGLEELGWHRGIAVSPAFSTSSTESERPIFLPMSDAPAINPNPIKSNSPVDCSVVKGPPVSASLRSTLFPATPRTMLGELDEPSPRPAKLERVAFARAAAGRHNKISAHSDAACFSLIFVLLKPRILRVLADTRAWVQMPTRALEKSRTQRTRVVDNRGRGTPDAC